MVDKSLKMKFNSIKAKFPEEFTLFLSLNLLGGKKKKKLEPHHSI